MNGKIERCINEGFAFTGVVILDRQILFTLRRDLWSSPLNTASDFVWAEIQKYLESLPRVKLYEVRFVESEHEWVPVAARSDHALADRVRWLTGMDVAAVRDFRPGPHVAEAKARRAPAPEPIPEYPCVARTEALEKAGLRETKFARPAGGKYR